MSRFFSAKYSALEAYTPGEQPRDRQYVKLNTNESPFPPSPTAQLNAQKAAEQLHLYSDPQCRDMLDAATAFFGVDKDELIFTNGSDDILNFAFMAFCDSEHPAVFPDITYGFYPVFADLNSIPYREIPLKDDFTVNADDYINVGATIFIANPNAPTGIYLPLTEIERIVKGNPNNIVVVDEAYIDFGGESAITLIGKYDNLLVTRTFSKSRSMAGARLGFGIGCKELIRDLETIRYSTNPYNINSMTQAAAIGSFADNDYFVSCCQTIKETRAETTKALTEMGFIVLDSSANFVFARHPSVSGGDLFAKLRERGFLIRHFNLERIKDYNRITIGSPEQMELLITAIKGILEETK